MLNLLGYCYGSLFSYNFYRLFSNRCNSSYSFGDLNGFNSGYRSFGNNFSRLFSLCNLNLSCFNYCDSRGFHFYGINNRCCGHFGLYRMSLLS